jgi:hypothetical protein
VATVWCEGAGEFQFFDESEFLVFGGVQVHAVQVWHLLNGDVVEMQPDGQPRLDRFDCPVVSLGDFSAAEEVGEFDAATPADDGYVEFDAAPGEGPQDRA